MPRTRYQNQKYLDISYLGLGKQHPSLPPRGQRELETVLLGWVHGAARHLVLLLLLLLFIIFIIIIITPLSPPMLPAMLPMPLLGPRIRLETAQN